MTSYDKHYQAWVNATKKIHPAHDYLEKPAMINVLKTIKKKYKKVLILGCGEGSEIEKLLPFLEIDASIYGIDSSHQLIEIAKYNYAQYSFECLKLEDLENIDLRGFDLIYSSLTMHYVEDWRSVFNKLSKICDHKAEFVFSIHHPIKWASKSIRSKEKNSFTLGYTKYKNIEKTYEIYGDYLGNQLIKDKLFGKIEIEYYNKSISEIFRIIKDSDFLLIDFLEPKPIEDCKTLLPDFYEVHSKIPLFAIFHLVYYNQ